MSSVELKVAGMSCGHCKMSIEKALNNLTGVNEVEVDLESKIVSVNYDDSSVSEGDIRGAIEEAGYEVD